MQSAISTGTGINKLAPLCPKRFYDKIDLIGFLFVTTSYRGPQSCIRSIPIVCQVANTGDLKVSQLKVMQIL